jgi:hypothetical protein
MRFYTWAGIIWNIKYTCPGIRFYTCPGMRFYTCPGPPVWECFISSKMDNSSDCDSHKRKRKHHQRKKRQAKKAETEEDSSIHAFLSQIPSASVRLPREPSPPPPENIETNDIELGRVKEGSWGWGTSWILHDVFKFI